jgi:predicted aspartyl protease
VNIKHGSVNFNVEVVIVEHLLTEALLGLDFLERWNNSGQKVG